MPLQVATDAGPLGPLEDFTLRADRPADVRRRRTTRRAVSVPSPLTHLTREADGGHRRTPARPVDVRRRVRQAETRPHVSVLAAARDRDPVFAFEAAAPRPAEAPRALDAPGLDGRVMRRRLGAAIVDVALLGGINVMVVYFTLKLTGLSADALLSPAAWPLAAFLLMFNAMYVVGLTATGGQTLGKMATGVRVVGAGGAPVTLAGAMVRTAAYVVSVLPAGAGFIGLFLRHRRSLHDVVARTSVIRVP